MRFNFVGEFDIAKEDAKVPGYSDGKTKNGDKYLRVNPICIAAKNNSLSIENYKFYTKVYTLCAHWPP